MRVLAVVIISLLSLTGCGSGLSSSKNKTSVMPRSVEATSQSLQDSSEIDSEGNEVSQLEKTIKGDTAAMRGRLAKLSYKQVQQLLNTELKSPNLNVERQAVIVPSYIPEGFEISRFAVSTGGSDYFYYYYDIVYSNQDDSCFLIRQFAFDGPTGEGPVEVELVEDIEISELGISVDLGFIGFSRVSQPDFTVASLSGKDDHRGSNYDFFSPVDYPEHSCSSGIEVQESVKIVSSLQRLDPNETEELKVYDEVCVLSKFRQIAKDKACR